MGVSDNRGFKKIGESIKMNIERTKENQLKKLVLGLIFLLLCSMCLVGCNSKKKEKQVQGEENKTNSTASQQAITAQDNLEENREQEKNESAKKDEKSKKLWPIQFGRKKNTTPETLTPETIVMSVGDISVTYEEVLFYIYYLKQQYEPSLGEGIWDCEFEEGKTFEEYAKEKIINQITELKVICQQAKSQNIELTDDEIQETQDLVAEYMQTIDNGLAQSFGITEELVKNVYKDNLLANKMFDITTSKVDTNISDEEAKQITIDYLVVLTKGVNKEGKTIDMSEEEKTEAKKFAKKLRKEAKAADNFYLFAEANSDLEQIQVTYGAENQPKEFGAKGLEMETGKLSNVIEGSDGYYIIYCESDFDEDATMQKKEDIISEKQSEVFERAYTEWSKDYKVVVATTLWEQIEF